MTLDENMAAQIERDEAWLADIMPADPPLPLERTKHRVHLEVNRAWLERNAPADPVAPDLDVVKRAVRAELEDMTVGPRLRRRWGWVRRGAALAAAAAVLFGVGLTIFQPERTPGDSPNFAVELDDWVDAFAVDALASADRAADLALLEDGLASLEVSLAGDGSSVWNTEESELEELADELETLLTEMG